MRSVCCDVIHASRYTELAVYFFPKCDLRDSAYQIEILQCIYCSEVSHTKGNRKYGFLYFVIYSYAK